MCVCVCVRHVLIFVGGVWFILLDGRGRPSARKHGIFVRSHLGSSVFSPQALFGSFIVLLVLESSVRRRKSDGGSPAPVPAEFAY